MVEKQTKVSMKEMARVKSQKNIKIDKALAAFKVNTFGVSDLPALLLGTTSKKKHVIFSDIVTKGGRGSG